jgi:UDP-N-acetylmuramyl pentapeptide phosphotransferase/UDP-N-acetylglucosamine-1-phosphate transferase
VAAAAVIEGVVLFFLLSMLRDCGALRKNYRGLDIPVSAGLSFPLTLMAVYLIYALFHRYASSYHLFILGIMAMSLLGFIDDMLGQRDTLGFRGHFGALFKGRLTTGGLKAVGGGFIALFTACFLSGGWLNIILNTLILALCTNMLNLLDLRPGRAIKGWMIMLGLVIAASRGQIDWIMTAPLLGAVLWYFGYDLKARAMMGDAGSNVLGLALGFVAVSSLPLTGRSVFLVFLLALHIYTEKYSLSTTIENNRLLRFIDCLGREKPQSMERG